jgi:hypothetical protein
VIVKKNRNQKNAVDHQCSKYADFQCKGHKAQDINNDENDTGEIRRLVPAEFRYHRRYHACSGHSPGYRHYILQDSVDSGSVDKETAKNDGGCYCSVE